MSNTNSTTIDSYNSHLEEYVSGTPQAVSGKFKAWIDENLDALNSQTAKILELGSAFGRDALYMESRGYGVERTDATPAFVELLQSQGHQARVLNMITDPLGEGYDMIFASAVLLHLTRDEARQVIDKVLASLKAGGRFVFSLKRGDGESWSEEKLGAPRFFCYWQQDQIEVVLRKAGFARVDCQVNDDYRESKPQWLYLTAIKVASHE